VPYFHGNKKSQRKQCKEHSWKFLEKNTLREIFRPKKEEASEITRLIKSRMLNP